jgi:hypothetical protein
VDEFQAWVSNELSGYPEKAPGPAIPHDPR